MIYVFQRQQLIDSLIRVGIQSTAVACLRCLPAASYLTAQTIMVDGGFTLSFPGVK